MENKIKNIDFRNAYYEGYINNGKFDKIGMVLSEDFLFCLAEWKQGLINGPCFTIFPNQTIFYGFFKQNDPEGLCCYEMSNDCKIYCNFSNSKMNNHCIAHFPFIQCLLQVTLGRNGEIEQMKEHYYESIEQKSALIEKLLHIRLANSQRQLINFIKNEFVTKWNELEDAKGLDYLIGMRGQGLGIRLDIDDWTIKSIGYFNENKVLKLMGKVIVREEMKVIEEGIHNKPQTLIRYLSSERPDKIRKVYRDQFRLGIHFQNKFLNLESLQKIQNNLNLLKIKIRDNTTQKIAQQLIENNDRKRKVREIVQNATNRSRLTPQKNKEKEHKNLNSKNATGEANQRMMNEVPLRKIKQQLDRSLIHRKHGQSPYKQFDLTPAELKYTSFTHGYEKQKQMISSRKVNTAYEQSKLQNRAYPTRQISRDLNKQYEDSKYNIDRSDRHKDIKKLQKFKYLDDSSSKSAFDLNENKPALRTEIKTDLSKSPNRFEAIRERSKQIDQKIFRTPISMPKNPYVTLSATADSKNNTTMKQKQGRQKYNDLTRQLANELRQTDYQRAQISVQKNKRSPNKQFKREMGFKEIKYRIPQQNTIKKQSQYYDTPSRR